MFKRPSGAVGFTPSLGATPSISRPTFTHSKPVVSTPPSITTRPDISTTKSTAQASPEQLVPKLLASDSSSDRLGTSAAPKPLAGSGGPPITPPTPRLPFKDPEPPRRENGLYGKSEKSDDRTKSQNSSDSSRTRSRPVSESTFHEQTRFEQPVQPLRLNLKLDVFSDGDGPGGDGDRSICSRCKGAGELSLSEPNPRKGALWGDRSAVPHSQKRPRSTRLSYSPVEKWECSSNDKQLCHNCRGDGKDYC